MTGCLWHFWIRIVDKPFSVHHTVYVGVSAWVDQPKCQGSHIKASFLVQSDGPYLYQNFIMADEGWFVWMPVTASELKKGNSDFLSHNSDFFLIIITFFSVIWPRNSKKKNRITCNWNISCNSDFITRTCKFIIMQFWLISRNWLYYSKLQVYIEFQTL